VGSAAHSIYRRMTVTQMPGLNATRTHGAASSAMRIRILNPSQRLPHAPLHLRLLTPGQNSTCCVCAVSCPACRLCASVHSIAARSWGLRLQATCSRSACVGKPLKSSEVKAAVSTLLGPLSSHAFYCHLFATIVVSVLWMPYDGPIIAFNITHHQV
jgi:hypothetical protein